MRIVVAGFGNELRGDDGFGIAVIRRLEADGPGAHVAVLEIGTAGLRLAQELLTPCDRLIVVDAMARGAAPGTLYVERVEAVPVAGAIDPHLTVPARALTAAKALGALPPEVFIVGCEPAEVDELTMALTPAVARAVPIAVGHVRRLIAEATTAPPPADPDLLARLKGRDEVLQILVWLCGEGLGPDVAPADVLRFLDDPVAVTAALEDLVELGYAEVRPGAGEARYRLTAVGEREGRRRFLDEFEPYLARGGHGECGLAGCDCQRGGPCLA